MIAGVADALALRPELARGYVALCERLTTDGGLPPDLVRRCAHRVAEILAGPPPDDASPPPRTPALTAAERSCLAFVEQFVRDVHGIDAALVTELARHLDPPRLVAFAETVAVLDGFTRARLVLAASV